MAIDNNMITDEVRANGIGAVDMTRLTNSMDQLALTYEFKQRPTASDIFDASFLPEQSARAVK